MLLQVSGGVDIEDFPKTASGILFVKEPGNAAVVQMQAVCVFQRHLQQRSQHQAQSTPVGHQNRSFVAVFGAQLPKGLLHAFYYFPGQFAPGILVLR